MSVRRKPIYGLGINDAPYTVQKQGMVNGKRTTIWICPFYRAWMSMFVRCYSSQTKKTHPTYIGCSVSDEWLKFSDFRQWMSEQEWRGMALDKDILFPGNKIYSPVTCIFVSHDLNGFTTDRVLHRGEWPLGVSFHKASSKFIAACSNPFSGVREYLGIFSCPESAHDAWRARKHQHACRYADMQTDTRIAQALRTRYLIRKESL